MHILLVNDDGYKAEGINTLFSVLTSFGHDVYIIAPHTEQSAKSHAMTVIGDVTIYKHDEHHYSLEGTPADCVIIPLQAEILPFKPDVVISGINHGYNLSSDTIYSGTCGAARQAQMYGYPAIAISANKDNDGKYDFVSPSKYLATKLENFVSILDGESFLSLNFPPHWNGRVEKASLGVIEYNDDYKITEDGDKLILKCSGCKTHWLNRDDKNLYPGDNELCKKAIATATIINIHPSYDIGRMNKLIL